MPATGLATGAWARISALPLPVVGAVGGGLLALGLPPLAFPPLAILGVLAFVWLLERASETREAALGGGAFAGAASLVALHWVPAAAEPWLGLAGGVMAGFSIWMLHACVGALVVVLSAHLRSTLPLVIRAAAAWAVLEWLPGALPVIGLPWFGVAATLTGWPLLLPLVAVVGSGGTGVFLAAGAAAGIQGRARPRQAAAMGVLVGAWVAAAVVLAGVKGEPVGRDVGAPGVGGAPQTRMAVLEWERPRGEVADPAALAARLDAVLAARLPSEGEGGGEAAGGGGLAVLWPEAPLPGVPGEAGAVGAAGAAGAAGEDLLTRYLRRVQESGDTGASGPGATAPAAGGLAGVQARVGTGARARVYNTLVLSGAPGDAPQGVHRKRHLVPGVERTTLLNPGGEGRGLAPGAGALPFAWGGVQVGGLICFEILYPAEAARLRRRGATLLVQATNDAMLQPGGPFPVLGDAARRQHEAMLQLRAAEFRVPMVRSVHGGQARGAGPDGRWMEPVGVTDLRSTPGEDPGAPPGAPTRLGRHLVFEIPPTPPVPPAAWAGPPLGPLALAVLLIPLLAVWRRAQVLGG